MTVHVVRATIKVNRKPPILDSLSLLTPWTFIADEDHQQPSTRWLRHPSTSFGIADAVRIGLHGFGRIGICRVAGNLFAAEVHCHRPFCWYAELHRVRCSGQSCLSCTCTSATWLHWTRSTVCLHTYTPTIPRSTVLVHRHMSMSSHRQCPGASLTFQIRCGLIDCNLIRRARSSCGARPVGASTDLQPLHWQSVWRPSLRCPPCATWASLSTQTWWCSLTCVGHCQAASQQSVNFAWRHPPSRLSDRLSAVARRCPGSVSTRLW